MPGRMRVISASNYIFTAIVCATLLFSESADSQIISARPVLGSYDNELKLLRINVRAEVREIMRSNFILPKEEAEVFWPLYVEYEAESSRLWDGRVELIREYGRKWAQMSEKDAQGLMDRLFELDDKRTKLRRRYFRRIRREVSATVALRFMQIDRRINNLIEIQLTKDIPLAK